MAAKPKLLAIKDVARILGVSQKTVRRLVERGDLAKPVVVGEASVRWWKRDVDDYLERLRHGLIEPDPPPENDARPPQ